MLDKGDSTMRYVFHESMKGVDAMARIGIRLTDQEKEMLAETAQQDDMTISQIVRKLIRKYIGESKDG